MRASYLILCGMLGLTSCYDHDATNPSAEEGESFLISKAVSDLNLTKRPIFGGDGVCYVGSNLRLYDIFAAFKLDEKSLRMVPGALEWEIIRRAEVDGWDIILTSLVTKPGAFPDPELAVWKVELTNAEAVKSRKRKADKPKLPP